MGSEFYKWLKIFVFLTIFFIIYKLLWRITIFEVSVYVSAYNDDYNTIMKISNICLSYEVCCLSSACAENNGTLCQFGDLNRITSWFLIEGYQSIFFSIFFQEKVATTKVHGYWRRRRQWMKFLPIHLSLWHFIFGDCQLNVIDNRHIHPYVLSSG